MRLRHCRLQEGRKLARGHFAHGHGEVGVLVLAETRDMAVDGNVVGRVGDNDRRPIFSHKLIPSRRLQRAATNEAVLSHLPEITAAGDRGALAHNDRPLVALLHVAEALDTQFDFDPGKPGRLNVEIEVQGVKIEQDRVECLLVPPG